MPLGYDVQDRKLVVNEAGAANVRRIFQRFIDLGSATVLARELRGEGFRSKQGTLIDKGYLYSAAVQAGDLVFISGQVGSRDDGTPEPDFRRQVQRAFDNLRAVLEAAGCTLDDIVDVTTFHTDPEQQFPTIMEVKAEAFPAAPYPNWTAVGVTWLAGFDFEIKVIARIPTGAN